MTCELEDTVTGGWWEYIIALIKGCLEHCICTCDQPECYASGNSAGTSAATGL